MNARRRLLGLLLLLSFFASPGGVQAARVCPHHSDAPAAPAPADAHAHAHGHEQAADDGTSHEDGAPCSCMGACVPAGMLALATAPPATTVETPDTRLVSRERVPLAAPRALLLPYALPWPNAPPSIHVG